MLCISTYQDISAQHLACGLDFALEHPVADDMPPWLCTVSDRISIRIFWFQTFSIWSILGLKFTWPKLFFELKLTRCFRIFWAFANSFMLNHCLQLSGMASIQLSIELESNGRRSCKGVAFHWEVLPVQSRSWRVETIKLPVQPGSRRVEAFKLNTLVWVLHKNNIHLALSSEVCISIGFVTSIYDLKGILRPSSVLLLWHLRPNKKLSSPLPTLDTK